MMKRNAFRMRSQGLTLIEVLVALTVLSLGLFGLAALQTHSIAMSQSSYYRGIAADLATDLADRIHANRSPFVTSSTAETGAAYPPNFANCPQNTSSPDSDPACSAQAAGHSAFLVSEEMGEWNQALRTQLPNATYALTATTASNYVYRYTLSITWTDDRLQKTPQVMTYQVVIE